jgi:phenylalanyl-tRNA synthetase beta chain
MPVIEVHMEDFQELLGVEVDIDEIERRLPMMGVAWEGRIPKGFSIEVFPNRPDMLSVEGLARAYAAFIDLKPGLRPYEVKPSNYVATVEPRVEPIRPYFASAVVVGLEFTDALIRSLMQLQEKLHITHCRKRRKVSIGLHDLEAIDFPVTYTARPPGFSFHPLDAEGVMTLEEILRDHPKGREYSWILEGKAEYPILMDAKEMVLSMPPIINSIHTRIEEETSSLFIDVTGTDMKTIMEVLNILTTTLADRGGIVYGVENRYWNEVIISPDLSPNVMELDLDYVNRLLGLELSAGEAARLLMRMGHGVEGEDPLKVYVPCYRTDVMHPFDLVEDVAIAYGYDRFIPEIPEIAQPGIEDPLEVFTRHLRDLLVGFGLLETLTFMMTNKKRLFEAMCLPLEPVAETENPKTEEYTVLRNRLLPCLMEVLSRNTHHPYPQNLFEVDDVILLDDREPLRARTARRLAVVLCHSRANFSEIKAVMESILENLGVEGVEIKARGLDCFIDGRRLIAQVEGRPLCWAGEIRPEVLENWGLEMPVAALEMDVDLLFELVRGRGD